MYRFPPSAILGGPVGHRPLTIVGAGISGLMLAWQARRRGLDVQVVELQSRAGGLIRTHNGPYGSLEAAANGFLWCPELDEMARHLGLELLAPGQAARSRYILNKGRLSRFPLSLADTAAAIGRLLVPHRKPFRTVHEFGMACLGRGATEMLLGPAMAGIYGADIHRLSFPAALPALAKTQQRSTWLPLGLLQRRRSITQQGKKGTHSFAGGLQRFTDALAASLGDCITYGTDGLANPDPGRDLVITVPAYAAASAFSRHEVGRLLAAVPYTPLVSVKVVFRKEAISAYKPGFGCLIPRTEGLQVLGVLFNHDIFPTHTRKGHLSFTAILRDDAFGTENALLAQNDDTLARLVCEEIGTFIPQQEGPVYHQIDRYERGIPIYTPEHFENLSELDALLKQDFPTVRLFGNYTGQISIRGMAQSAAKAFLGE